MVNTALSYAICKFRPVVVVEFQGIESRAGNIAIPPEFVGKIQMPKVKQSLDIRRIISVGIGWEVSNLGDGTNHVGISSI